MPRLIVNADDFGLSPAVSEGIMEAHAVGSVTSTSMMVRCPGWDDGVQRARATPSLGVGLHFNLLVGVPLSRSPTLTDSRTGYFQNFGALAARVLRRSIDRDELAAECEAQLAALAAAGIAITHIDSHRHVHAMPVIRGVIASIAAQRGLPLRRPVESARWFPRDGVSQLHRAILAWSWNLTTRGAPRTRAPDHFIGVSMQGSARFAHRLDTILNALPTGSTELMVHPGHVDATLQSNDNYTWQRERELEALLSKPARERLSRGDIELIGFGAL